MPLLNNLDKQPPDTLYHYTSLDAFVKIVNTKTLWASNLRYLNDSTEFTYLLGRIRDRIDNLIDGTADPAQVEGFRKLSDRISTGPGNNAFGACFSTLRDDLSQWRGYCSPGRGVCIGISSQALQTLLPEAQKAVGQADAKTLLDTGIFGLIEVNYIGSSSGDRFDDVITHMFNDQVKAVRFIEPEELIHALISSAALNFKSDAFKDEREWRLIAIASIFSPQPSAVHFRSGQSTLIPYIKVDLSKVSFLDEVVIGPSPNMNLSSEAVREFLRCKGLGSVRVTETEVPYRHW